VIRSFARLAIFVLSLQSAHTLLCDLMCAPPAAPASATTSHCHQHEMPNITMSAGAARCDHSGDLDRLSIVAVTKAASLTQSERVVAVAAVVAIGMSAIITSNVKSARGRPSLSPSSYRLILRV
jgi:hypothetical protein